MKFKVDENLPVEAGVVPCRNGTNQGCAASISRSSSCLYGCRARARQAINRHNLLALRGGFVV